MGGKPSKSGASSQRQSSLRQDSHTSSSVDPDTAPRPSNHHQGNGFRNDSNIPSSSNGSSDKVIALQLRSYEKACRQIPEIKSFDETLRLRAQETISAIVTDADKRSISLATLRKASDYVFDTEADAVNRILQSNDDICQHPELKALVEEYFGSSSKTLQFCLDLKKCVMNARNKQMMSVKLALMRFEEEEEEKMDEARQSSDGIAPEKFRKTLEELRRFTELGEPFTVEFLRVFESVRNQQSLMLDKLNARRNILKQKLRKIKSWKKVSGIIFASTFAVGLVCTVVAAALSAPAVVTALATVATTAFGPLGKWFQSLWKRYEDPFRKELSMINGMEEATATAIEELNIIRLLVDHLTNDAQSLLETAKFALRYDDAVSVAIKDIHQKLNEFEEWLNLLEKRAETCGTLVREARTAVCQRIRNYGN